MATFRVQVLSPNGQGSSEKRIDTKTYYSANSTDWSLLNLVFTEANYGIQFFYDKRDRAHADVCLNKITITHSVY